MEYQSLLMAYGLVGVALAISAFHHLRMERDIVWSSLRATVQLTLMGFVLEALFRIERPEWLFLVLLCMCGVAGWTAGARGAAIPQARAIAIVGIVFGSFCTFAVLYAAGVIRPEPSYILSLGGMIIGNSMKACSLALNRLTSELGHQRQRIETLLALGANARQATLDAVRQSVKASLIPTVDSMKTVGLVHLPGIMSGYIIAGGAPLTAIKYQLAVMYMLAGAAAITCFITTLLAYRRCFNDHLQLLRVFRPGESSAQTVAR
jgi:putative ABC transport system permease protein